MVNTLIITARTSHPNQDALMDRFMEAHSKYSRGHEFFVYRDWDHKGFSFAMNHGLAHAIANDFDYVLLIGNDGVPTAEGWVEELVRVQIETGASIVCPTPNRPNVASYNHLRIETRGPYTHYHMFPAICWLIPRKVILDVGFFDEQFGAGTYEDNDYCERVKALGGAILRTDTVEIDHLLSQTMANYDVPALMQANLQKYKEKWKQ